MPVTFAPPQPFAPGIAEGYGRTTQFNQTLPTLAGLAESTARMRQQSTESALNRGYQASAQSSENAVREAGQRDDNQLRDVMQVRQIEAGREEQQRAIHAHQQSQAFDWAMRDRQVGQQDILKMEQKQAGLAQLEEDVRKGYLTPEQAADAAYQLRTDVDRVRQRVEAQQAQNMQAQAKLRTEEGKRQAAAIEAMDAVEAQFKQQGVGVMKWMDPDTGKPHLLIKNRNTGEWYNPLQNTAKQAAKEEGVGGEWAHLGTDGRYDEKKGLADAKAYAEGMYPPLMEDVKDGDKVRKVDKNAEKRAEMITRRMDGTRKEFREGGRSAGQQESAQGQQQAPSAADRIMNNPKLDGMAKSQAISTLDFANRLAAKKTRTPEEVRQLKDMLEFLDGIVGK